MKDEPVDTNSIQKIFGEKTFETPPKCEKDPFYSEDLVRKSYVDTSGARIFNSMNQSIPRLEWKELLFDSVHYDTGEFYNPGTPSRLISVKDGVHIIVAHFEFAENSQGFRHGRLIVNSETIISQDFKAAYAGAPTPINTFSIWEFKAGDYIEVQAYQNSISTRSILATPHISPELSIHRL